eukprot:COSAG02_NODE_176_length_31159_cov_30.469833_27_plen_33_part_00
MHDAMHGDGDVAADVAMDASANHAPASDDDTC